MLAITGKGSSNYTWNSVFPLRAEIMSMNNRISYCIYISYHGDVVEKILQVCFLTMHFLLLYARPVSAIPQNCISKSHKVSIAYILCASSVFLCWIHYKKYWMLQTIDGKDIYIIQVDLYYTYHLYIMPFVHKAIILYHSLLSHKSFPWHVHGFWRHNKLRVSGGGLI